MGVKDKDKADGSASGSALPSKEAALFRSMVKMYEMKQYKKALKAADQILRKVPAHGETLAMKGLVWSSLGPENKSEAYDMVRAGLRADLRSHVCWHVYGLLYRADRDYKEASKAYLQALRIDKDNMQILRDLALLQVQCRDFEGFESTRRKLLTVKPNQNANWIAFALAHQLNENHADAVQVLNTYEGTLKDTSSQESMFPYEASELAMYKHMLLFESKEYEKALQHLEQNEDKVVDKLGWTEARAQSLAMLERYDEAEAAYRTLLHRNPENKTYIARLADIMVTRNRIHASQAGNEAVTKSESELYVELCDALSVTYPEALSFRRLALEHTDGDDFLRRADVLVRRFLYKGVPSLFSMFKSIYRDQPHKAQLLGGLFESYAAHLNSNSTASLPPFKGSAYVDANGSANSSDGAKEDNVSEAKLQDLTLWVDYFLVQHYVALGQHERALQLVNDALLRTPSSIELLLVKGRVLKVVGDVNAAVSALNAARKLDLADRYLNHKCAKYAMRANRVDLAEQWIGLFTREGDIPPVQAMYEMQCLWFELESGAAFLRRGLTARALKRFIAVDRHFADFIEDQFDFHNYCVRKMTLRSYVQVLRLEDHIKDHHGYMAAMRALVRLFLRLADQPLEEQLKSKMSLMEAELEKMTAADRKKALAKRKKAEAKEKTTEKDKEDVSKAASGTGKKGDEDSVAGGKKKPGSAVRQPGWMETDPDGVELLRSVGDFVEEAHKYANELDRWAPRELETQVLVFDVALRRKKVLVAARAYKRAQTICRSSEALELVCMAIHLLRVSEAASWKPVLSALPAEVSDVFQNVVEEIRGQTGVSSALEYAQKAATRQTKASSGEGISVDDQLMLARALLKMCRTDDDWARDARPMAVGLLLEWPKDGASGPCLRTCEELYLNEQELALGADDKQRYVQLCLERFPRANVFGGGDKEIVM
ncbi:N-terminal acetyltransferase A complex auxiliary subunit NAA15 [Porphyridium purpureum]|uniref:N-terminal acetyltransferase A complex auxiliary subunit NAA15 n=1 Tax=Porphyridium purpureum TaxID=35688 RepID=A0A5J4YZD0_PORPP|nr:N-terminal acetyltransferase A complex auxiliary subunit NAA15 [Porphyridium purpureum]|eukprot:POR4656..scf209_3